MELSQETTQPADHSLRDEIADIFLTTSGQSMDPLEIDARKAADKIMTLLMERGHYLPGAPPAAQILADAKSFAERLTLSNLALRILNMLAWSNLKTPETKPARRWIEDYLEGKLHGPVGQPMLWPAGLPGMAAMLRGWGFEPTPTKPPYVARSIKAPGVQ